MTREEIAQIIDPAQFTPFVVVTGSGSRFPVNHPDFVDLPPIPEEQDATIPSFVVVYNRNGIPRLIMLANIHEIAFEPGGSMHLLSTDQLASLEVEMPGDRA